MKGTTYGSQTPDRGLKIIFMILLVAGARGAITPYQVRGEAVRPTFCDRSFYFELELSGIGSVDCDFRRPDLAERHVATSGRLQPTLSAWSENDQWLPQLRLHLLRGESGNIVDWSLLS